ncbi:hypothetical protein WME79_22890 [Sorangium sp. So ce726]|uniref:hypothetical protein n=1 Tax=Sorangium sp. So ce726 TaxID=3133319 RepID=UPI003F613BB1
MLRVKRHQRSQAGDPAFVDRTAAHFRRFHGDATAGLSDDELRFRIRHGIERGRAHGLTWESSLTVFVAHMIEICPAFDEHPAAARVLADEAIPADERVEALLSHLSEDEWEEAARMGDPAAYWARVHAEEEDGEGRG